MPGPVRRASLMQYLMQRIRGAKKVDLPVSVYGKLPFYKDFLRHSLAGSECQAFKRWLDQGISQHWANSEPHDGLELATNVLFLTFPATGRRLLVYQWGSHDTGGLRRFPFAIFVSLPTERSGRLQLAHLGALGQMAAQAEQLRQSLAEISGMEQFQPLVRTSAVNLVLREPNDLDEWFEQQSAPDVGTFAHSLFPDDPSGRPLRALLRILDRLSGRDGIAVRLPASDDFSLELQASVWSLLLEGERSHSIPLQILAGEPCEPTGITLIRRDLRSDDVFALHPDLFDYEYVTDLRHDLPAVDELPELTEEEAQGNLTTLLTGQLAQVQPGD